MNEKILSKENNSNINTPQELIDQTIVKVEKILNKHFPDHLSFGDGSYTISHGTTQIMIVVRSFTDEETSIECISQLVHGANITPELMNFLLRKNAELHIGAFGLLFDDTITFSHSITGSNLDPNELITTLNSVAAIADYYDVIIVEMAGGKTAIEMLDEEI
jgi:hypothetical protein